jgi:hypothetical protein
MDEKEFMIGVIGRSKRVFSKDARKRVTAALHGGNREWVTTLAPLCADGTALPSGIIYRVRARDARCQVMHAFSIVKGC